MAIQISGTTVVNNSRQLQNIASLDSTTTTTLQGAGLGGIGFTSGTNLYLDHDFRSNDQYVFPTGEGDYLAIIGNSRTSATNWYIDLEYTSSSRLRGGWYSGGGSVGSMLGVWENGANSWRYLRQQSNAPLSYSSTTLLRQDFTYGRWVLMRLSLGSGTDQVRFFTANSDSGGKLSIVGIS